MRQFFIDFVAMLSLALVHAVLLNLYNPEGMFKDSFPFHASTRQMLDKATVEVNPARGQILGRRRTSAGTVIPVGALSKGSIQEAANRTALALLESTNSGCYQSTASDEYIRAELTIRDFSKVCARVVMFSG